VVNGIVKAGDEPDATSAIGLIPYGTGNDFACGAGISATDPAAALGLIFNEPARPIDVGRLNDRCFVNLATGGFVAEVTTDTPDLLRDALGGPAYTLAGAVMLIGGASRPARVTADGLSFDDNLLLVAIGNGRFAGGGFCLTPDALIDDGLLDVIVIERMSGPMLVQLLQDLRGECHLDREDVHHVQVRRLVVEAPEPLQINLDGEPMTDTRFTAHVLPAAVRMHLPGGCPMLSQ
jgi:YegS/Rv2252/BmrU family lipid kinase